MSWLIQVFIENTRMSHFFLSLSVSLFVIARLVIYFFMSLPDLNGQSVSFPQPSTLSPVPLNIIVLPFSPLSLPSPLSVITRLDRVISLPLLPIFRMPQSSRSIHLLPTSSQQSCLGFLYSVMPRLDRGISRLFPCHLLPHPPGAARPGNRNSLVPRE